MKQLACLLLLAVACAPELDERGYLVTAPRVLTVLADPPEARPSQTVELRPVATESLRGEFRVRFCTIQRPLADPRPIAEACLHDGGVPLQQDGSSARGSIPADACSLFGPDPARAELRPADADETGGFYQPVVLEALGMQLVSRIRIKCRLPDAPADLTRELDSRYELNQPPTIAELSAASPLHADEPTELRVELNEDARERYVWLPSEADALESRREAFRVDWFTSAGTLASSATGRDEQDPALFSSNTLTPPAGTNSVTLWVVIQDSRGATATISTSLEISPVP